MQVDPDPIGGIESGLTDGLGRGLRAQRLEVLGEVVGCDEDQAMRLETIEIVVVEDFDCRILDRPVLNRAGFRGGSHS